MEIYTPKTKIKLSPVIRNGREFVEVTFGNDNDIRLSLSKEENVLLVGGRLSSSLRGAVSLMAE